MKKIFLAFLATFPLLSDASVITTDSFKVKLPLFFSEVSEKNNDYRKSWSFSSQYGTFKLAQEQCEGCLTPTQASVTELLGDSNYSDYGAAIINVNGLDGFLAYVPTRKQVMLVSAEFVSKNMKVKAQLVTRKGIKPHEVQIANVEFMRLLNAIEFK